MTFPSEDARRDHFLGLLAEKLTDPAFRAQEGFPKGTDEAILAMSDPPYYTACPNPWLAEFVTHYGRPYDPAEEYAREPMAIDVSEGLCCANPVRDSSRESSMVAGVHEQTHIPDLQDQELASL
jgi:hypothetical protein